MPRPYARIADRIAERIAKGELPIGSRLPPQRRFAYTEGIAVSTASRVYEELRNRGLVAGEVGRGTFVTNRFAPLDPALQEPPGSGLDLEIVFRLGADARQEISASALRFFKAGMEEAAAAPPSVRGNETVRRSLAALTATRDVPIEADALLLAGSGKEAIAACLSALAPRGGRIGVEAMTYPFVLGAARQLGIELVPLPLDDEGVVPDSLDRKAAQGLDGLYLQPTLQSPLVLTMTQARRRTIAEIVVKHDLATIEDRVYGFMRPTTSLAAYAPDHIMQIDSLSKRLMPGLAVGWIVAPSRFHKALARSLRAGGWMAPALAVALAQHWTDEDVVSSVEATKRREAAAMFDAAKAALVGLDFRGADDALHAWIALPSGWRGEAFAAASAELGIAVAPGRAFAVTPGTAPSGVRIACSAPDLKTWQFALSELGRMARRSPPN